MTTPADGRELDATFPHRGWLTSMFGLRVEFVEDPTLSPDVIRMVYRRPLTEMEQKKLVSDVATEMSRLTTIKALAKTPGEGRE